MIIQQFGIGGGFSIGGFGFATEISSVSASFAAIETTGFSLDSLSIGSGGFGITPFDLLSLSYLANTVGLAGGGLNLGISTGFGLPIPGLFPAGATPFQPQGPGININISIGNTPVSGLAPFGGFGGFSPFQPAYGPAFNPMITLALILLLVRLLSQMGGFIRPGFGNFGYPSLNYGSPRGINININMNYDVELMFILRFYYKP